MQENVTAEWQLIIGIFASAKSLTSRLVTKDCSNYKIIETRPYK